MKQSRKIELFNRINNKYVGSSNKISLLASKDAKKYLEILYKEGKVSSYSCVKNQLTVIINEEFDASNEKILIQKIKNRPSLKYKDILKIRTSLKTIYFHTNVGLKSLYEVKKEKLGGIPVLSI